MGDLLDCTSLCIVKALEDCVTRESTDMAVKKPEVVTGKDVSCKGECIGHFFLQQRGGGGIILYTCFLRIK